MVVHLPSWQITVITAFVSGGADATTVVVVSFAEGASRKISEDVTAG